MKKIIYIISSLLLLVGVTSSCNVTREPKGTVKQYKFTTVTHVVENRDALYALIRGIEAPNNLNTPDVQSDMYHLTMMDNNSLYGLYNWQKQSVQDNSRIVGYYGNYYSVLMQANYFISRSEEMLNDAAVSLSQEDRALVEQYVAEIKVIRALAHWRLLIRFSKPWNGTDDDAAENGIIEVYKYEPLVVAKAKKSSRKVVYDNILKDLDEAIAKIPANANKDVKPAMYITQDYANAVKARVCLFKQDWQGAVDAVDKFINNYPLTVMTGDKTADIDALDHIWKYEDSSEILVRLFANAQFGASTAETYAGYMAPDNDGNIVHFITPSLILEPKMIKMYEKDDIRKNSYIGQRPFYRAKFNLMFHSITKFEGNPSLDKDKKLPENKFGTHLFNVGEAYLIKAEALLNLNRGSEALETLKLLRKARGLSTSVDDYPNSNAILDLLKKERICELVGEGWRLNDLVRWGEDMQRGAEIQEAPLALDKEKGVQVEGRDLKITADNQMFIWEFPIRDMESNANLNNHRNWN